MARSSAAQASQGPDEMAVVRDLKQRLELFEENQTSGLGERGGVCSVIR